MAARKGGLIAAAGATYLASAYCVYHYVNWKNAEEVKDGKLNNPSGSCCKHHAPSSFSYVSNPNRTQTFQEIALSYDRDISNDEYVLGIPLMRRWLLYKYAKGNVLEVGGGTGRNIPYYPLDESIKKIVLTDNSEKMLLQALEKIPKNKAQKSKFSVIKADVSNLTNKFRDNTFDTVVDTFGLCSFDDPILALREMARVCNKENGKIILLEHGKSEKHTFAFFQKYLDTNAEHHAKLWGCVWNRDIEQIVKDAGLNIEYMTTWHFGTTFYIVCTPNKDKD